jgi:hypothetical protein
VVLTAGGQAQLLASDGHVVTTLAAAGPFSVGLNPALVNLSAPATIRIHPYSLTQPAGGRPPYVDDVTPFPLALGPAPVAAPTPTPIPTPTPAPVVAPVVRCVVPRVTGLTTAAARARLRAAHCALGTITRRGGRSGRVGRIVASTPKAGKTAVAGTKIAVTVRSRGR